MDLPTYYTFNDFFFNYDPDLLTWKNIFPDGSEKIFLSRLLKKYERLIDPIAYETKEIEFSIKLFDPINLRTTESSIHIKDLCCELDCRIFDAALTHGLSEIYDEFQRSGHFRFFAENNIFDVKVKHKDDILGILALEEGKSIYSNSNILYTGKGFKLLEEFVRFETITEDELQEFNLKNEYEVGSFMWFDYHKYENYKISMLRIYDWIKDKIDNPKPWPVQSVFIESKEVIKREYSEVIIRLADEVFSADKEKLSLLEYLADNFSCSANNFTELTKYNQIYFYLNSLDPYSNTIPQAPYKKLIKEMFGFDYGKSEIKGETPKHQTQLGNIALNFKNNLFYLE